MCCLHTHFRHKEGFLSSRYLCAMRPFCITTQIILSGHTRQKRSTLHTYALVSITKHTNGPMERRLCRDKMRRLLHGAHKQCLRPCAAGHWYIERQPHTAAHRKAHARAAKRLHPPRHYTSTFTCGAGAASTVRSAPTPAEATAVSFPSLGASAAGAASGMRATWTFWAA